MLPRFWRLLARVLCHPRLPLGLALLPALRWLRWQDGVYVPFLLPPIGGTVRLPPAVEPFEPLGGWS